MRLDLSACRLLNVRLPGIDIDWANLKGASLVDGYLVNASLRRIRADRADMRNLKCSKANLWKARLPDANLSGANFGGATLIHTHLERANLNGCNFRSAKLQGAHLEGANLNGARFEQANLKDVSFRGAHLDDVAKRSIVLAREWRTARFDEKVRNELTEMEKNLRARKGPN